MAKPAHITALVVLIVAVIGIAAFVGVRIGTSNTALSEAVDMANQDKVEIVLTDERFETRLTKSLCLRCHFEGENSG